NLKSNLEISPEALLSRSVVLTGGDIATRFCILGFIRLDVHIDGEHKPDLIAMPGGMICLRCKLLPRGLFVNPIHEGFMTFLFNCAAWRSHTAFLPLPANPPVWHTAYSSHILTLQRSNRFLNDPEMAPRRLPNYLKTQRNIRRSGLTQSDIALL